MNQVDEYISSKQLSWSKTTITTERSRLRAHVVHVDSNPEIVYKKLSETMKPYTIKTTFIRLGEFYQWLMETGQRQMGINPWKRFMESHANLFKHVYQSERLEITYDEAKSKILSIQVESLRTAALQLLEGGLRSCELSTFDGNSVTGKGGKRRMVFLRPGLAEFRFTGTYPELYGALKAVGLKPHTLRKLCATAFGSQAGVNDIDIKEVFGWESIETSAKYRQPKRQEQLAGLLKKARGE